ncbi:hypothetical protein ACQEU6_23175 [Spirillospora sp. CA-108201]
MDTEQGLPRRPGEIRHTPSQGIPKATPREGTPVQPPGAAVPPPGAVMPQTARPGAPASPVGPPLPPDAPTRPIVHTAQAAPAASAPPRVWGTPPRSHPAPPLGGSEWAAVPEAQDAYSEPEEWSSGTGPMGVRETSGVQVRLGSRERERERRERRRKGRRSGLVAAGVLVLAGLVTAGLVLTPGSGDEGATEAAPAAGERAPGGAKPPPAGSPITVGTADGSRYRIAAVTSGISDGVVTASRSTPPSGTAFPYIEYILANPGGGKVLLDFPGDVFVRRDLVTPAARGRCMPQAGVPEALCTPPTDSQVVRRLAGGALVAGEGGDKYLPPGSSYLVRATVDVPVARGVRRSDMALYVWKQLYMADRLARRAPFPKQK